LAKVPGSLLAASLLMPWRSARVSEHLIRLRKGWEAIDLESPDPRPERIALPLPVGWISGRRLRLTRRFGSPTLVSINESLWLRLESVAGLAALRLNGRDIPVGPHLDGTSHIRLLELPPRNELSLELCGVAALAAEPTLWGEIALLIRSEPADHPGPWLENVLPLR
jgi:hypothetical protein